ncbi:MAG TPA: hypothetical protein VMH27_07930 [Puia sp.]|nr:hypothetical protein [Puia sp.]
MDDIKRRMFLKERSENRFVPDQFYSILGNEAFRDIKHLNDVISIGIYNLAECYLEFRNNRIHVRQKMQNEWQRLITYIPPLYMECAYLQFQKPLLGDTEEEILAYYHTYILPNTRYTAMPYPYIPQLEAFVEERGGLHDLHIHLNGATETDLAWQDFLLAPDKIYKEFSKVYGTPKVKEQLEQESHLLDPLKFRNALSVARRLRHTFFDFVFGINENNYENLKTSTYLPYILDSNPSTPESNDHPFLCLVNGEGHYPFVMSVEALMYVLLLRYMQKKPVNIVTHCFHFYLLILGLTNRLLVQQTHQNGFQQFQKHTLNGLREHSEKDYVNRFFQMHGNEPRNIAFLEGRFSPKTTRKKNTEILNAIKRGWQDLEKYVIEINRQKDAQSGTPILPKLMLIAHFIKTADSNPDPFIRHKALRFDIWQKAKVLALMIADEPHLNNWVVGIDAAASEFDTPPEVFAPVFRMMRRAGIRHFTYHAGEDFFHIVSGLRAVYEAVIFTDMHAGDRIGHATATGISVLQWSDTVGNEFLIQRGEWLDNLIFAHHIIISENMTSLFEKMPDLINKIEELSMFIYGRYYIAKKLEDMWLNRRFCPLLLFAKDRDHARMLSVFDENEWCDIQNIAIDGECLEMLRNYHAKPYRDKYEEPITIRSLEPFNHDDLKIIQLAVLNILHRKEIVIETLPTSNVRISLHRDFSTYHLWNWIRWEEEGHHIPPIVVGSDDTGIFATSIYNEYANIYCHLTNEGGMTHSKAMQVIERLDKNSQSYRFE